MRGTCSINANVGTHLQDQSESWGQRHSRTAGGRAHDLWADGGRGEPRSSSVLSHSDPNHTHGASTAALPGPEAARQPQACFYSALFLLSGALVVEHLGPRLFLTVEPGTLALTESGEACRSLDAGVGAFVASWMSRLRVVLVGRLLVGRFPAAPCLDPTE